MLAALAAGPPPPPPPPTFYVSCGGGDDGAAGSLTAPFGTLRRARDTVRAARGQSSSTASATVFIREGVCELASPLQLDARDSGVVWSAYQGESVLVSAGLRVPAGELLTGSQAESVAVDLTRLNLTANDTGLLRARGFSGHPASIALWNYEPSAMELFYRRPAMGLEHHYVGKGGSGAATADGQMVLARYPNLAQPGKPSTKDWDQIHSVEGDTIGLSTAMSQRAALWRTQLASSSGDIFAHGLWSGLNWADSHRPVTSIVNHSGMVASAGRDGGGAALVLGLDGEAQRDH